MIEYFVEGLNCKFTVTLVWYWTFILTARSVCRWPMEMMAWTIYIPLKLLFSMLTQAHTHKHTRLAPKAIVLDTFFILPFNTLQLLNSCAISFFYLNSFTPAIAKNEWIPWLGWTKCDRSMSLSFAPSFHPSASHAACSFLPFSSLLGFL